MPVRRRGLTYVNAAPWSQSVQFPGVMRAVVRSGQSLHRGVNLPAGETTMQRFFDLVISVLGTVAAMLLSWPYWRDYEYWAESQTAWMVYFAGGFLLSVYVFYAFIGSTRILFGHAADEARQAKAAEGACCKKAEGDRA